MKIRAYGVFYAPPADGGPSRYVVKVVLNPLRIGRLLCNMGAEQASHNHILAGFFPLRSIADRYAKLLNKEV